MPFPTDPIKAEEARIRMRAGQARRWSRPEEREKSRQAAIRQFSDPTVRQKMRETKLAYYALPESRQKTRDGMRRHYATRPRTAAPSPLIVNHEARVAVARHSGELRLRRLELIKQRAKPGDV